MGLRVVRGSPAKYYVDAKGAYMGGWADNPAPPGGIEVPDAPDHASWIWDFTNKKWGYPAKTAKKYSA